MKRAYPKTTKKKFPSFVAFKFRRQNRRKKQQQQQKVKQ